MSLTLLIIIQSLVGLKTISCRWCEYHDVIYSDTKDGGVVKRRRGGLFNTGLTVASSA